MNETAPIIESFKAEGKLREVDSMQPVDKVFDDISKFF
jgi:adenylate kinase family enzyme